MHLFCVCTHTVAQLFRPLPHPLPPFFLFVFTLFRTCAVPASFDVLTFQMLASVVFPGFTINRWVAFVEYMLDASNLEAQVRGTVGGVGGWGGAGYGALFPQERLSMMVNRSAVFCLKDVPSKTFVPSVPTASVAFPGHFFYVLLVLPNVATAL